MIQTGDGWPPAVRAQRVALWTPVAAVVLSLAWSGMARLTLGRGDVGRLTFWAGDLPFLLFGVPSAAVWLWASLCSAWKRQGWLVLILVVYNGAAVLVAVLGMVVVAGLPVGDL